METARSSGAGSGNSGTYTPEIAETLRFEEEIQNLVNPSFDSPPSTGGSSFTALLGLPANQAVELLHEPESSHSPAIADSGGDRWPFRLRDHHKRPLRLPLGCSPTFPSNAALVERAARFSVFAAEESPEASSVPSNSGDFSPRPMKTEPADSDSRPICPIPSERQLRRPAKRKEGEKRMVRSPAKKSRSGEERSSKAAAEENTGGDQKLSYVHVRARRGQATDSHSLAERARREKINARMKLLQELVPGCNKISGTALVLDEIINHVQSLQRQVEFLSMRLAAVNPRIDFSGLDSIFYAECGRVTAAGHARSAMVLGQQTASWSDNGDEQQHQPMWPQHHNHHHHPVWERDHHVLIGPPPVTSSLFGYDSACSSVSLSNQLKTQL